MANESLPSEPPRDETSLVAVTPGDGVMDQLAFMSPAALQQRLTEYTASRKIFVEWVLSALVAGVDYMLIHKRSRVGGQWGDCPEKGQQHAGKCAKCGAKATLCKPGAEKICGLLQVVPRFLRDTDTWEMLGSPAGTCALTCQLWRGDVIVAEGRGIATLDGNQEDPNKAIKMAQKSGQIDATLRMGGLSEVFTLDLDDMVPQVAEKTAAEAFPPPRRTDMAGGAQPGRSAPKDPAPPPSSPTISRAPYAAETGATMTKVLVAPTISRAQQNNLEGELRKYAEAFGVSFESIRQEAHDRMLKKWTKSSFKDLTVDEYTVVMQWLNGKWNEKA
jgi:hypothetical protein